MWVNGAQNRAGKKVAQHAAACASETCCISMHGILRHLLTSHHTLPASHQVRARAAAAVSNARRQQAGIRSLIDSGQLVYLGSSTRKDS